MKIDLSAHDRVIAMAGEEWMSLLLVVITRQTPQPI